MSIPTHVCPSTEICPQLAAPLNGRMLGRSLRVGHEVHFICDAGFRLVGSETRACRHNRTWSGTQPFCRSEWGRVGVPPQLLCHPELWGSIAVLRGCSNGHWGWARVTSPADAHELFLPRY